MFLFAVPFKLLLSIHVHTVTLSISEYECYQHHVPNSVIIIFIFLYIKNWVEISDSMNALKSCK